MGNAHVWQLLVKRGSVQRHVHETGVIFRAPHPQGCVHVTTQNVRWGGPLSTGRPTAPAYIYIYISNVAHVKQHNNNNITTTLNETTPGSAAGHSGLAVAVRWDVLRDVLPAQDYYTFVS